jgi:hypothetical protein
MSGLVIPGQGAARSATEFSLFLTESFRGDYLDLRQNADIITMIFGYGTPITHHSSHYFSTRSYSHLVCIYQLIIEDTQVVFGDYVEKLGSRGRTGGDSLRRVLIFTERAVYDLYPKNFTLRRRIPISMITSLLFYFILFLFYFYFINCQ